MILYRGEITSKHSSILSVKTYKENVKILFNCEDSESKSYFNKFNVNDRIVIHCTNESLIIRENKDFQNEKDNCGTISDNTAETDDLMLKFAQDIKIVKDPFKNISDLQKDKYSDIIAVCSKFKSLISTKGTDFVFSLDLVDLSDTIELKVFTSKSEFEDFVTQANSKEPFSTGDILLIRNVKRSARDSLALAYKPCLINKIKNFDDLTNSSLFVQNAIAKLLNESLKSKIASKSFIVRKTLQIKDLKDHSFFNIIGKVISCDYDVVPSIKITDFTFNQSIDDHSKIFPNSMVLLIKLFGQHSYLTEKITIGGYFQFSNIRCRFFSPIITAYMHDSLEGDVIAIPEDRIPLEIQENERKYNEMNNCSHRKLFKPNDNIRQEDLPLKTSNNSSITSEIKTANDTVLKENCTNNIEKVKETQSNKNDLESSKTIVCTEVLNQDLDNENDQTVQNTEISESDISKYLTTLKIREIIEPGIYLSTCYLSEIRHFATDIKNLYSILYIKEDEKEYLLKTKRSLTKKMMINDKICVGNKFKCLVLLLGTGEFFMIDIFTNKQEYQEFIAFYLQSIKNK